MIGVTDRDVRNVKRLRDYRLELIIRVIGGIRQRRQGMGSGKLVESGHSERGRRAAGDPGERRLVWIHAGAVAAVLPGEHAGGVTLPTTGKTFPELTAQELVEAFNEMPA